MSLTISTLYTRILFKRKLSRPMYIYIDKRTLMQTAGFIIERNSQILHIKAVGPWTFEAFKEYTRLTQSHGKSLKSKPWAILLELQYKCILTPEAREALIHSGIRKMEENLRLVAILEEDMEKAFMTKLQFSDLYAKVGIDVGFFQEKDEAMHWLKKYA